MSTKPSSNETHLIEMHYFFDSSFPVGYFSHSFGFESFVTDERNDNLQAWSNWIKNYLMYSIWYCDLEILDMAFQIYSGDAAIAKQLIEKLDGEIHASRTTAEARNASLLISNATKRAAVDYLGIDPCVFSSFQITEPAILVGLIRAIQGWDQVHTRLLFAQSHTLSMTQVLLRYAKIGQRDQLKMMASLLPLIEELALTKPSQNRTIAINTCYELEFDQMKHENLSPRLFQS